jgi:hypothetical protein
MYPPTTKRDCHRETRQMARLAHVGPESTTCGDCVIERELMHIDELNWLVSCCSGGCHLAAEVMAGEALHKRRDHCGLLHTKYNIQNLIHTPIVFSNQLFFGSCNMLFLFADNRPWSKGYASKSEVGLRIGVSNYAFLAPSIINLEI